MSEPGLDPQRDDPVAPPERQIDRKLLTESRLFGVPYAAYTEMTPRERGAVKGRWVNKLRQEAKRRNVDADEFVSMTEEAREEARANFPEHIRAQPGPTVRRRVPANKTIEDIARAHADDDDDPPPSSRQPRSQVAELYDEGLTDGEPETYSQMDDVPPTEADPKMRANATLGDVRPTDNEDLVGWKQPRNLRDVYARFTIGDGQHFVRVERIDPKVWQQIPCSGYLGEIREPVTEPEFHAWYGGRVYALTVYGPDPKGRRDASTGLPIIKAKTEPFRYTVPMLPPNLAVLPGNNPTRQQQGESQMHPFAQFGAPQGLPATPADAQMHKTNIDFMQNLLRTSEEEKKELRRAAEHSGPSKDVLQVVSETSKQAVEQANRAADQREAALQEQLKQAREDNRALAAKIEKVSEQQQQSRPNPVQDAVSLMNTVNPGRSSEEEVKRLREAHTEEAARIREGHRESLAALKERQDDELKRLRERLDDVEKVGRSKLDDAERRWREREKELRDQMDQQRRDERDTAERRVTETVARFEDRMKDLREQHNRELRMQTEQHATRVDTTKGTWEMQLTNSKERIARLEADLEEAQAEAERSKDPVQVMEKVTAQAEAMGFTKKEDDQTAGERFIGTVGMGLSKALETMNDWLPRAMAARGPGLPPGPSAPRALPPGPGGQPGMQQQRVARQPNRRAVAWASQGSIPIAGQQPTIPADVIPPPVVMVQPQPMAPQPFQPPPFQTQPMPEQPVQAAPPPAYIPPPVPQQQPVPQTNGHSTNALGAIFPDEAIVEFRTEVERAINAGMPADMFAERFVKAFPEPTAMLVQAHKPDDFIGVIRGMPNGAESVILRRDGKRWVDKLWEQIVVQHQARAQQQGAQA
jgi:hypothetical protein